MGAGDGPCVFVGVGARNAGEGLVYPVSELALGHRPASARRRPTGKVAYADVPETTPGPSPRDCCPTG